MYHEVAVHVVIPAYNVAPHITAVVTTLPSWVDTVWVVDDASTDATAERLREIADPRLHRLSHAENQGVGGAMVTGFRAVLEAHEGIVVKMDGDGQMDPAYLPALLDPLVASTCDYTKGNRFLSSHALEQMPTHRLIGNFALTFLTKLASGYWNIFDPQNGYLAIPTVLLKKIDLDHLARRYFFENDMLIHLNILGVRAHDVDIPARYGDEISAMRISRIFLTFPRYLFRRYWYRFYQKHVLRNFSPIALFIVTGLPLLLWGTLFGLFTWYRSVAHHTFASTGTVMLSVLPFIVGFELVLQAIVLEIHETPK